MRMQYFENLIKKSYNQFCFKRFLRKRPTESLRIKKSTSESEKQVNSTFQVVKKKLDLKTNERLSTIARIAIEHDVNLLKQNSGESLVNEKGEIEIKQVRFNYKPATVLETFDYEKESIELLSPTIQETNSKDSKEVIQKLKLKRIEAELVEDPSKPVSNANCSGCGAKLHCQNKSLEGFMSAAKFTHLSISELKYSICYRCELLRTQNKILNFTTNSFNYDKLIIKKLIRMPKVHIILMVDLLDIPNSIYDGWSQLIKSENSKETNLLDVCILGNKFDLLPNTGIKNLDFSGLYGISELKKRKFFLN